MERWEYCFVSTGGSLLSRTVELYHCSLEGATKITAQGKGDYRDRLARILAELGAQGWEMVGVSGALEDASDLFLKRPKTF